MSEAKFAKLAGYDPELVASKRFGRNLKTTNKAGVEFIGRNPNFGLDIQATVGYNPSIDLTDINRVLRWDIDDELKKKFFMYNDNGTLKLNMVGRDIFEFGCNMSDINIRYQVYDILMGDIYRQLRENVKGDFGTAAPLSLLPAEHYHMTKTRIVVGYSGGIIAMARVAVVNDLVYVEDDIWTAMGRDFDGDLAFTFRHWIFPNKRVISNINQLRANYVLPKKVEELDDRNDIDTLIDILKQSKLCGILYHNGKIFVDACRMAGLGDTELVSMEVKVMAMVEQVIHAFKGKVNMDKVPKPKELCDIFCVPEASTHVDHVSKYFYPMRTRGMIVIDDVKYHPLEVLKMRSAAADPGSKSFWERVVSKFVGLELVPVGIKEVK